MTNDQRRTIMSEVSISRKKGMEREGQIHSTAILKTFIKEMTLLPKSIILDLGCICDSNIELFTHLGCKVFVKDLLNANARTWADSGGMGEISLGEIRYETLPLIIPRNKIYYNRDVADLFSDFSSYTSYILKNRWREVIARK